MRNTVRPNDLTGPRSDSQVGLGEQPRFDLTMEKHGAEAPGSILIHI